MVEQDDDSRDRIDPVTASGLVGPDADQSKRHPMLTRSYSFDQIGTFLNTGYNIVILIALGFSMLFLQTAGSELAPNSSLISEIIPTMIQAWVMLAFDRFYYL